jgi:hypothetical protein
VRTANRWRSMAASIWFILLTLDARWIPRHRPGIR